MNHGAMDAEKRSTEVSRFNVHFVGRIALALTRAMAAPSGSVTADFVQPEKFTDVRDRQFASAPEKNPNMSGLRRYLETWAVRYLKDGLSLKIEFTDIDLAGDHRTQTHHNLSDVRLVSNLFPPSMQFNYLLTDPSGASLKSGKVKLSDLGLDAVSSGVANGPQRYEQFKLDKWLRQGIHGQ
jgi:hypothetical protein